MSDFRKHYKGRTIPFGDTNERRRLRVQKHEILRKSQRTKALDKRRNLSQSEEQVPVVREDRSTRLLKWKSERDRQKRLDRNKKKPAFVVGIVHHKIYSPISNNEGVARTITHKKLTATPPPKKITRATEKRLKEKAAAQKAMKTTVKSTHLAVNKKEIAVKKKEESFAPVDHIFKAPAGLTRIPAFGRVLINSMSPVTITEFMSSFAKSKRSMTSGTTAFDFSLNKGRGSSKVIEQCSLKTVPKIDSENINNEETEKNNTSLKEPRTTRNSIAKTESFADAIPEKKDVLSKKHRRKSSSLDRSFTISPTTVSESRNKHTMSNARSLDTSPESVVLKLSSDDEKQLNSINIRSSSDTPHSTPDKNGIDIQNHESNTEGGRMNKETLNNSVTRTLSSSSNNNTPLHSNSSSDPAFFSPYVVSSRGKSNARKEQQLRRGFSIGGSPHDDIPTKDTVMKHLNISVEEEERTAQYFLFLLNKEIDRLNELCRNWVDIKEDPEVPEDAQYQINQAIGQTKLLISKKFERFRGLVRDCETGMGEMLITCKDLQGFWDMMYMEIKDCDSRFEKLQQLRSDGWEEAAPSFVKPVRRKAAARKKAVPAKSSSIKAFMAERRKILQKSQDPTNTDVEIMTKNVGNDKLKYIGNSPKTRRSMSFGPNDTKSTPSKQKETRFSLLQRARSSGASKKTESPLTVMKISQMFKTLGDRSDDTTTYVNSNQTPGKSILKPSKRSESCTRSTNKVNFNDDVTSNEVVIDKDAQTKRDLAAALARIDSYDLESMSTEVSIRTDRKLDFDDASFEESEDVFDRRNSTERTNDKSFSDFVQSTPLKELKSNVGLEVSKLRKSLRRQNAIDEEKLETLPSINIIKTTPQKISINDSDISMLKHKLQDHMNISDENEAKDSNESIRSLRNRSITLIPTPNSRKSLKKVSINVQELEHKENETPRRARRKSSMKVGIKSSEEINTGVDSQERSDKISADQNIGRRRSRRSVKFSDCSVCVENKPTLPMTPHVRRSRTRQSGEEKLQLTLNKSSSLTETPVRAPERIRRSAYKKVQTTS